VRCLLVPALMVLVGKANWYLPKWIDRAMPHVSIEGAEFFRGRDQAVVKEPDPELVA
jgi:RND superfamily putative drug exporter